MMDIRKSDYTASFLIHLLLGCLKHLDTNKCNKNNENIQQVTLQGMKYEPFLPLSRAKWVTTFCRGILA